MACTSRYLGLKSRIVVSRRMDPDWNLAVEEYLLDSLDPDTVILLLYVNRESVVMGKHQNPWRECSVPLLARRGISLLRRISGGGTVFHDPGNINFSFLSERHIFNKEENLNIVLHALRLLGIEGSMTDRGDILVRGRKVSGNALCFRREKVLHHGTLLVDADLSTLREVLSGYGSIETHAVASNPFPVMNLRDADPSLDPERVKSALMDAFNRCFEPPAEPEDAGSVNPEAVEHLSERNRSWLWIHGASPRFIATLTAVSGGRSVPVEFRVEKGVVTGIASEKKEIEERAALLFLHQRFSVHEAAETLARFDGTEPSAGAAGTD